MDRFLVDIEGITIGGKRLSEMAPSRLIDEDAFIESGLDTPAQRRDKKRRRQIARKQMVEQGILPPSALNNKW